jgi:hypothetical protein
VLRKNSIWAPRYKLVTSPCLVKLSDWEDRDPDDFDPDLFIVELCASPSAKEQLMDGSLGEVYYRIQLPNASADAVLVGEPEGRTLIEYLELPVGRFPRLGEGKESA